MLKFEYKLYDDWYEMMLNVERWWIWRGGEQNEETANGDNETMEVRKWQNGIARDDECEMEVKWWFTWNHNGGNERRKR